MPEKELNTASWHAQICDLMIVLGSSLTVNPAASLVGVAIEEGARVVLINQGDTPYDDFVALRITSGIGNVLPLTVELVKMTLDDSQTLPGNTSADI